MFPTRRSYNVSKNKKKMLFIAITYKKKPSEGSESDASSKEMLFT
jgi:hypothetical protein